MTNYRPYSSGLEQLTLLGQEGPVPSELLDFIGGEETVRAATEAFYKRVFADETLRPFFETTDVDQLLARQRMFLSMLLGGLTPYTGKDIGAAHRQAREQGLNDGHFDRFIRHFRDALKEVGVDPRKARQVIKLLESKRGTVLNP
jgi:hemoglobin